MQPSAAVTQSSHKQSDGLGATPSPLYAKSEPSLSLCVPDSCSARLLPLPLCREESFKLHQCQQQLLTMGQKLIDGVLQ